MSSAMNLTNSNQSMYGLNNGREFEDIQNRTFCKWLNARIAGTEYEPLTDLGSDFHDGTRLIQLIGTLTEDPIEKYNRSPALRVQKAENVIIALTRIKEMGIILTNIGPEDIIDGNRKLILGLIWSLVLRFTIAAINEEGSHAKEGLLLWCQRKTMDYAEVDIVNFTKSWSDGLALCALIHHHRPDLLNYAELDTSPTAAVKNTLIAFRIAERSLGIPRLLEVDDICGTKKPDERSVMTYVAQFFHAFSSKAREETAINIISNFTNDMSSLMTGIHDYERRAKALLVQFSNRLIDSESVASSPSTSYPTLKSLKLDFETYVKGERVEWFDEKVKVAGLLRHVRLKLKTYGMKGYDPPMGLRGVDIDEKWALVGNADLMTMRRIIDSLARIREELRLRFAQLANGFGQKLDRLSIDLAYHEGALEEQSTHLTSLIQDTIPPLHSDISSLESLERVCVTNDAAENERTIHSAASLKSSLAKIESQVTAMMNFVENQITSRTLTKVSPEQMEEFESAFRNFDKSSSNGLDCDQLMGALGSLGIDFVEEGYEQLHERLSLGKDQVGFEEFTKYLIGRNEDRLTPSKVRDCFRGVASTKPYITELDLYNVSLPTESVEFLIKHMPVYQSSSDTDVTTERNEDEVDEEVGMKLDYTEFLDGLFL